MNAIELEQAYCAHTAALLPVVLARGTGVWVWDVEGTRYLDMTSAGGAAVLGHAPPRLLAVLTEQARRLSIAPRTCHSERLGLFAQRLCALSGLDGMIPMNSGAEAVETALKAARRWGYRIKSIAPNQAEIVVVDGNCHGCTTTLSGLSDETSRWADLGPFAPGFITIPFGSTDALRNAITPRTCALLIEPIQGEDGVRVPPTGFLRELRALCERENVLLLLDEVRTGLARTGKPFAFQHDGILPDGLVVGTALGGGLLPASAFVARSALLEQFEPGDHESTCAGNPLAAAVGLAVLDQLQEDHLAEHSAELGQYLLARLRAVRSPLIRDVRGRGLWVGVELDPARASARDLMRRMQQRHVLVDETRDTVVRFSPPLVIGRAEIDQAVGVFKAVLGDMEEAADPDAAGTSVPG